MKAVIITNGVLEDLEILKKECADADFIICADGGAEFALLAQITPDYLIGDFDSINKDTLLYYKQLGIQVETYPAEKDFTDTELCINKAIKLGSDKISIVAGIGGRIDHSIGNIGLLHQMIVQGVKGSIVSDDGSVYLCNSNFGGELTIKALPGSTVSIIPMMGDAEGVTLIGFKYPLHEAFVEYGKPIGISNKLEQEVGIIKVRTGELLVILPNTIKYN